MRFKEMAIGQSNAVQRHGPHDSELKNLCSGAHRNNSARGICTIVSRLTSTSASANLTMANSRVLVEWGTEAKATNAIVINAVFGHTAVDRS